jgi:hypothetical protein
MVGRADLNRRSSISGSGAETLPALSLFKPRGRIGSNRGTGKMNQVGIALRAYVETLTALCVFIAIVSYFFGDAVRGPFANLTHPRDRETFEFVAGGTCLYPFAQFKDGIDFSDCIRTPGQPIELWAQKKWWSGLRVKLTLKGPNGVPFAVFENQKLRLFGSSLDVNYDAYAFELVGPTLSPEFQLVVSKDYDKIYLNARINTGTGMLVIRGTSMRAMSFQDASKPESHFDRLFKYPSSLHHGERD